jgi:predicted alpha/beta-fold hydrolase
VSADCKHTEWQYEDGLLSCCLCTFAVEPAQTIRDADDAAAAAAFAAEFNIFAITDEFDDFVVSLLKDLNNPAFRRYYRRASDVNHMNKYPVPIKPSLRRPTKRGVPRA